MSERSVTIEQVERGFIVTRPKPGYGTERVVFRSFDAVVQGIAFVFGEAGVGETWKPSPEKEPQP